MGAPSSTPSTEAEAATTASAATLRVVKVGGANLERPAYVDELAGHVADCVARGERVVVVHGGGSEIGALHDALDVPFRKLEGLRVTSDAGMAITTQVLCGLVNKRVVARFVARGLPALGMSGVDLGLLRAELLDAERFGRVGDSPRVDVAALHVLLDAGLVPVIAPVSLGPDEAPVNVNADAAAHALATALGAETLDFLSDVPGVRVDPDSQDCAERLHVPEVRRLTDEAVVVTGGMIPKLRAAAEAVERGVRRVRIGNLSGVRAGRCTEIVA